MRTQSAEMEPAPENCVELARPADDRPAIIRLTTEPRDAGDAGLRLCVLLTLVPRAPRRLAARALVERLAVLGFVVTVRTIERDLQKLRTMFPLDVDESRRPYGWSWASDAPQLFPVMERR